MKELKCLSHVKTYQPGFVVCKNEHGAIYSSCVLIFTKTVRTKQKGGTDEVQLIYIIWQNSAKNFG